MSSMSYFVDCNLKQSVELPYFSKYLLIAAYLASYNPAKSDRKFFVKVGIPGPHQCHNDMHFTGAEQ